MLEEQKFVHSQAENAVYETPLGTGALYDGFRELT